MRLTERRKVETILWRDGEKRKRAREKERKREWAYIRGAEGGVYREQVGRRERTQYANNKRHDELFMNKEIREEFLSRKALFHSPGTGLSWI